MSWRRSCPISCGMARPIRDAETGCRWHAAQELDAEVARMIDDPRFSRFVGEFTSQWLALDKFQVLEPDRTRFPKLTRDTRAQLRQEPVQFVQYLIRNNLPVRNLIDLGFCRRERSRRQLLRLADKRRAASSSCPIKHGRRELGGRSQPGGDPGGVVGRPRIEPGEARSLAGPQSSPNRPTIRRRTCLPSRKRRNSLRSASGSSDIATNRAAPSATRRSTRGVSPSRNSTPAGG